MSPFEELDFRPTELGHLVLRRRRSPALGGDVFEVILDGEFLMSSHVHDAEVALAELALEPFANRGVRVLVGGLGLGHTVAAALDFAHVEKVVVVEYLAAVIDWHREKLVPLAHRLIDDPRCVLVQDDFFDFVGRASDQGVFDAILLDIDHSPELLLHGRSAAFYHSDGGIQGLVARLARDGVFALWSADRPTAAFLDRLGAFFARVRTHSVRFPVPHLDTEDTNTIVLASRA